jgi:hypothetical protein
VLLIDNHKSEIFEFDVGLQQLVGANDDIDTTGCDPVDYGLRILLVAEALQIVDLHWPVGKSISECLVMLLRQ